MARRSKTSRAPHGIRHRGAPANPCRILVWIDAAPLREEALRKIAEIEARVARVNARIAHWQTEEHPKFQAWLAQEFGAWMTRIREATDMLRDREALLEELEEEQAFTGCTPRVAWERVSRRRAGDPAQLEADRKAREKAEREMREQREAFEARPRKSRGSGRNAAHASTFPWSEQPPHVRRSIFLFRCAIRTGDPARIAEARTAYLLLRVLISTGEAFPMWEEFVAETLGVDSEGQWAADDPEFSGEDRDERPPMRQPDRVTPASSNRPVKLFREIARRLHPDSAQSWTEAQKELWHEAQAAYEARDEELLELILTRTESESERGAGIAGASLGVLLRRIRDLRGAASAADREIRRLRLNWGWGFTSHKTHARLRARIARDLARDLAHVQEAIRSANLEIARYERAARPKAGPKTPPRRPPKPGARPPKAPRKAPVQPPEQPEQTDFFASW